MAAHRRLWKCRLGTIPAPWQQELRCPLLVAAEGRPAAPIKTLGFLTSRKYGYRKSHASVSSRYILEKAKGDALLPASGTTTHARDQPVFARGRRRIR